MHPVIQRLADLRSDELSVQDVADVIKVHRSKVNRIIERPGSGLEASAYNSESGRNRRWRISREALLRYLVACETGDKSVLLEAIAQYFPGSGALALARAQAKAKPVAKTATTAAAETSARHPDQMLLF